MNQTLTASTLFLDTRTRPDAKSLLSDNRGAVMLTGLFMSFFLVGALWFVIGVGDAVVFRDRMQEAADHGAFSSAALHAKGMNFISACNLVMMVMVIVHIVLGIIHDFALAACILSVGAGCPAWVSARNAYTGYASFMKPVLTGIHIAELVASYGYPWLGTLKGYNIGQNYGGQGKVAAVKVIAISPSNIPGALLGGANAGLPVQAEPMNFLCQKVVGKVWDFGKKIAEDAIPGLAQVISSVSSFLFGTETIMDIVEDLISAGIKLRYCNNLGTTNTDFFNQFRRGQNKIDDNNQKDSENNEGKSQTARPQTITSASGNWSSTLDPGFDRGWGSDGPMVVNDGAGNGKQQFFVWAMNFGPEYKENNDRRVQLAKGPTAAKGGLGGQKDKVVSAVGYFAQAEFYYDCKAKWDDSSCNSDDSEASFGIKWRARLRHLKIPNLGELLANFALDRILNSGAYTGAVAAIEDTIRGLADGPLAALGLEALNTWVQDKISEMEGQVRDAVTGAAGQVNPLPTSYH